MRALTNFLHATSETAAAVLNVASISVAAGALAAVCTQQLRYGVIIGIGALVCAGAGFGFSIWRTYRPRPPRHSFLVHHK